MSMLRCPQCGVLVDTGYDVETIPDEDAVCIMCRDETTESGGEYEQWVQDQAAIEQERRP